jgi:glycosyltransferase involved in cell wall biosynthesis
MKILWVVNTLFPAPSKELGLSVPVVGGWMYGLASQICKYVNIELAVATTYEGSTLKEMTINGIQYFLLPSSNNLKYDTSLEIYWAEIAERIKPDIIHIHGTEFAHGLSCMRKLPNIPYVISIQGLVSIYTKYYFSGISLGDIAKNITFRDLLRLDTIINAKAKFKKRGILEKEYIKLTKNVIGRTSWDYANTKAINPFLNYHFCNETLRDGFYSAAKWKYEKCEPNTIFLSQADYPIKGLHQVLKALKIVKHTYPNVRIKVGGNNIIKNSSLKDKIRLSGYGKYIKRLITDNALENNILFLGTLTEDEMIKEYLSANLFICPSSIENSPNSLGEAQMLGVPVIASYVGGVPDMVVDGKTGFLYRFEEINMLALLIEHIFSMSIQNLNILSINEQDVARKRHDSSFNVKQITYIYNNVCHLNN